MKIALRHAHPFDFAAERLVLGAVLLFAIIAATGRRLTLASYRMAIVLGFVQVGAFVLLSHYALLVAGPGKTAVLTYTMPFWMLLFAAMLLGERMRGVQWLAVGAAFAGLVLIVSPWRLTSLEGSVLAVASGAVWAFAAVLSKKWPIRGADLLTLTAWQLLFGSLPLVLLSCARARRACVDQHYLISPTPRSSRRRRAGRSGPTCSPTPRRAWPASIRSACRCSR
jgi:drug/metabolite transporter (DMT)-like permease